MQMLTNKQSNQVIVPALCSTRVVIGILQCGHVTSAGFEVNSIGITETVAVGGAHGTKNEFIISMHNINSFFYT
jgi:ABC-type xylose transport system permease subunit